MPIATNSRVERLLFRLGCVLGVLAACVAPGLALGQAVEGNSEHVGGMLHPMDGRASFEVASIRRSAPGAEFRFNGIGMPPGHFEATGTTVRELILFAYAVPDDKELVGGPSWMRTERYDIVAKPAPGEVRALDALPWGKQHDQYRMRVQRLLEERFQLRVSFAQKTLPVLVLEVSKGGLRCKRTAPDNETSYAHLPPPPPPPAIRRLPGAPHEGERDEVQWSAAGLPFPLILAWISEQPEVGGRTVVDRTGLSGGFACELTFTRDVTSAADSSFFTALREQMGLRLRPERGPVETLIVEGIERPSAN